MMFRLVSPAFESGDAVPRRHTCEGDDVSPALAWSGAPAGTEAFALLVDDPDAPSGHFTHWIVCDLPGTRTELDEGEVPIGTAVEGSNDFGRIGYGGPCPPPGHGAHHYRFTLHALGQPLRLKRGFSRRDFEKALSGRVLGTAILRGTYERAKR